MLKMNLFSIIVCRLLNSNGNNFESMMIIQIFGKHFKKIFLCSAKHKNTIHLYHRLVSSRLKTPFILFDTIQSQSCYFMQSFAVTVKFMVSDFVIAGAGHNSLITACYLAKSRLLLHCYRCKGCAWRRLRDRGKVLEPATK